MRCDFEQHFVNIIIFKYELILVCLFYGLVINNMTKICLNTDRRSVKHPKFDVLLSLFYTQTFAHTKLALRIEQI